MKLYQSHQELLLQALLDDVEEEIALSDDRLKEFKNTGDTSSYEVEREINQKEKAYRDDLQNVIKKYVRGSYTIDQTEIHIVKKFSSGSLWTELYKAEEKGQLERGVKTGEWGFYVKG